MGDIRRRTLHKSALYIRVPFREISGDGGYCKWFSYRAWSSFWRQQKSRRSHWRPRLILSPLASHLDANRQHKQGDSFRRLWSRTSTASPDRYASKRRRPFWDVVVCASMRQARSLCPSASPFPPLHFLFSLSLYSRSPLSFRPYLPAFSPLSVSVSPPPLSLNLYLCVW